MALCLVAYPSLKTVDRDWIQSIRRQYDPQYGRIEPHFTLIFPTDAVESAVLEQHASRSAWSVVQFSFVLRCALPMADRVSGGWHLFLVPDEGLSALVRLHAKLYRGPLASALRHDLPFIPHLTVGSFADPVECKTVADRINARSFAVEGWIEELALLRVDSHAITPLAQIELPTIQRGKMAIL